MRKMGIVALAIVVSACMASEALALELYSAEDYQYAGTGAVGSERSQRFSPSESTPNSVNPLDPTEAFFDAAAMKFKMGAAGESAQIDLTLYPWVTDYNTSLAQTPIAQITDLVLPSGFEDWVELSLTTPQSSSGQYLISAHIDSMVYVSAGFGVYRSNSGDGGPNNDAYNGSSVKTDREYQVRINPMPEPATLSLLALGGLALRRRKA